MRVGPIQVRLGCSASKVTLWGQDLGTGRGFKKETTSEVSGERGPSSRVPFPMRGDVPRGAPAGSGLREDLLRHEKNQLTKTLNSNVVARRVRVGVAASELKL